MSRQSSAAAARPWPSRGEMSRSAFLRTLGTTALGAGVLLGAEACGSGGSGGGSSGKVYHGKQAAAHLQTIQTGAPFYIAEAKGYFEDERLDLKSVEAPGGTSAIRVLLGSTHIGMTSTIGAITAYAKGVEDVRIIGGIFNMDATLFLAPADSKISLDDLRGKKIGSSSPDSITTYFAHLLAREHGLTPGKDVKIVYAGGAPDAWAAAQHGVIDLAWSNPPFSTKLVEQDDARVVIRNKTLKPKFADNVLVTSQSFIDDHADVLERWLRALGNAIRFMRSNTDEAAKIWAKGIHLDQSIARKALDETLDGFSLALDHQGIEANIDAAKQLGQLRSAPDLDTILVDRFIPSKVTS
ncbi:MAG: ABC transporter substrate-binding protein [Streptosporangiaceae bacterium]